MRGVADAEGVVQPGEVGVGPSAPELAGEVVGVNGGVGLLGPMADFVFGADVGKGDFLVFVEEKYGCAGGMDDFLDLVFAQVAVEAGLFVEAVRFVDDEAVVGVFGDLGEFTAAEEEGVVTGFGESAQEFAFVNFARGGVFGDVRGV